MFLQLRLWNIYFFFNDIIDRISSVFVIILPLEMPQTRLERLII